MPNPGALAMCVCVGAGVGHMLVYEAAPDSIYKKMKTKMKG